MSTTKLTSTNPVAMNSTTPCRTTKSRVLIAPISSRPMPGNAKIVSTSTVPPISRPILMPVTVTRVSDDGFSAWHQQDAPAPEALGGGHRDVIFLQCRDHVGAQHAHQHRPFAKAQRHGRQHEGA